MNIRRLLAAGAALALVAASCGGDDSGSAAEPSATIGETSTTAGSAPETSGAAATTTSAGSTAPSAASSGPATTPPQGPESVKLGALAVTGSYPPHDLAVGGGFIEQVEKQFGTKLDVVTIDTGANINAALIGGSIDMSLTTGNATAISTAQGNPLRAVFVLTEGATATMVGLKKYETERGTGVDALRQYEGGTWCVPSIGGNAYTFTSIVAKSAGVEWDDQNVVAGGSNSALGDSLRAGRCDVISVDNLVAARVIADGTGYEVLNLSGPQALEAYGTSPYGYLLSVRQAFLDEHPELTAAIVQAELQGLLKAQELADDPDAAYQLYPQDYRDETPPDVFDIAWGLFGDSMAPVTGLMPPERTARIVELFKSTGLIDQDLTIPDQTFDDSLVRQAYESLGLPIPQ